MLMFTLDISCLTTSNLPWLVNLKFLVYYAILLFMALNLTFITRNIPNSVSFLLWPAASHFLELMSNCLCPVAYWTYSNLARGRARLPVSCLLLFYTVHGVLAARIPEWFDIPIQVDHVLSELFTLTLPFCVTLHSMAHSFIELCELLHHDKAVIHEGCYVIYSPLVFSFVFISS